MSHTLEHSAELNPTTVWSSTKLQPHHFEGSALVYVRQSTRQQVLDHQESTARQYSLVDLAVQLGWSPDQVEVIDEDQGQSGSTAESRYGFQRLLVEIGARRFESDRAQRQYQVVEPENRLVARELERQWEAALENVQTLEQQYARFRQSHPATLTNEQRKSICCLSTDLPALWRAATTTWSDRQRIVRLLIERVLVTVQGTSEHVDVSLTWSGGFVSQHELTRPVRRYDQTADYERLMSRVAELYAQGKSCPEIAEQLNQDGFRPVKQAPKFRKSIVERLVRKLDCYKKTVRRSPAKLELHENEWVVKDLAKRLNIPRTTLMTWIKRGWVHVVRQLPGYRGHIICWVDGNELSRLQRLRKNRRYFGDPPLPKELTTPGQPES